VHLTDVPTDRRFQKKRFTGGGTGKGVLILARREASDRRARSDRTPAQARVWRDSGKADPKAFDELIAELSETHGVPPALVKAVVKTESNFHPRAVSRKGAQGLMQLMPGTADDLGVDDPFQPEENVRGGVQYLRDMMDRFGDWRQALAAYNAGPEAVDRYGGIPPYPETEEYVARVLHYYRRYHGDFSR
jgi:soluble lytic murein transglycosylase-like protein